MQETRSMGEKGSKNMAEMTTEKPTGFIFWLRTLFCRHEWQDMGNRILLESALHKNPSLQTKSDSENVISVKLGNHRWETDIFFNRIVLIFQCQRCSKLKIWKS